MLLLVSYRNVTAVADTAAWDGIEGADGAESPRDAAHRGGPRFCLAILGAFADARSARVAAG